MKKTLFWHLFFPIMAIILISLVGITLFIPSLIQERAEQEALQQAERTAAQFKIIRGYYTQNVVAKVLGRDGLKGSFNHKNETDSIPLPATMIHDLSELLAQDGTRLKLYSAYPFPNRQTRQLDEFGSAAWSALTQHPDRPFMRTETLDGSTRVRVAIADFMVAQACVDCHNTHPDTPKNDWKLGDVRGVLEIESPIDSHITAGEQVSLTIVGLMILLLLVLTGTLFVVYRHSIGIRLKQATTALQEIAQGDGDLSRRLSDKGEHEVAQIGKAFNTFVDKLQGTVRDVVDATNDLASVAGELSGISSESQRRLEHQDRETEHVATAVNKMESTARSIAENTLKAVHAMEETIRATKQGSQVVRKSLDSTNLLAQGLNSASGALNQLQLDSNNIGGVLDVIRGIAEQTNLLALNAAIEAARAGEQGRGFAVVADEVRTLAGKTQESTSEIQEMTERLRLAIDEVVHAMQNSLQQVSSTVALAGEVDDQLHTVSQSIDTLRHMNIQIADAAEKQTIVVSEVNNNLAAIMNSSIATAEAADHTTRQADQVKQLTHRLQSLASHFRL